MKSLRSFVSSVSVIALMTSVGLWPPASFCELPAQKHGTTVRPRRNVIGIGRIGSLIWANDVSGNSPNIPMEHSDRLLFWGRRVAYWV